MVIAFFSNVRRYSLLSTLVVCCLCMVCLAPRLAAQTPLPISPTDNDTTPPTSPQHVSSTAYVAPRTVYWVDVGAGGGFIQQVPEGKQVIPLGRYVQKSVKISIQPNDFYGTLYKRARYGITFYSATFGTQAVGRPYAIYPWYEIPFIEPTKHQRFSVGHVAGFGIAWNFVPYDPATPTPNIYIGSHLNCALEFGFYAGYHITSRLHLLVSTGLKHFSNGAIAKPNKGINLVPLSVSLRYQLNDKEGQGLLYYQQSKQYIPLHQPHWRFNLAWGAGLRQELPGAPRYSKHTLIAHALYQLSYRLRLGGGVDMFISTAPAQRNDGQPVTFRHWGSPALVARGEWMIRQNVSIPMGIGVYVLPNNINNGEVTRYYERIGVKVDLTSKVYASFGIKAHAAQADFFELSLGYTFHRDKNTYTFDSAM